MSKPYEYFQGVIKPIPDQISFWLSCCWLHMESQFWHIDEEPAVQWVQPKSCGNTEFQVYKF